MRIATEVEVDAACAGDRPAHSDGQRIIAGDDRYAGEWFHRGAHCLAYCGQLIGESCEHSLEVVEPIGSERVGEPADSSDHRVNAAAGGALLKFLELLADS